MKVFAYGFSRELTKIAEKNRPPATVLTYDQVIILSALAGYDLVDRSDDKSFTIYHPNNHHGLDKRLNVCWVVSCSASELIYRPCVQALYHRGNDSRACSAMEDKMSSFLPLLGFVEMIKHPLPERVVFVPSELARHDSTHVMFLSEFKEKYKALFISLFNIFKIG